MKKQPDSLTIPMTINKSNPKRVNKIFSIEWKNWEIGYGLK